ncbi:MAG: hypothetical protein KJ548_13310 [Actinobacteria bacterium]|nr:hypothetical protein [Actinomycetota bacterium]MCG2796999.1 hypothetical protein [Cellulomonas sp.]
MSTVPGEPTWRDAGLRPVVPEEPVRLTEPVDVPADPEDYRPGPARPDLDAAADEADVLDQDTETPLADDEDEDA